MSSVVCAGTSRCARSTTLEPVRSLFVAARGGMAPALGLTQAVHPVAYSSLPGLAMDGAPDSYPTRDQVAAYLTRYKAGRETLIGTSPRTLRRRHGVRIHGRAVGSAGRESSVSSGST